MTALNLTTLSDEALQEYAHKIWTNHIELIETIYIETIDYEKILLVIGQNDKTKLDTVWERATHPTFVSFEGRHRRHMLELATSNRPDASRAARYIFTDYFSTRSTNEIENAVDSFRHNINAERKEIDRIFVRAKEENENYQLWLGTLDDDSRRIAEYMQLMMYLRDIRKDSIAQMLSISYELFAVMLERAGIDSQHAPYVLVRECMQGVEHLASIRKNIEQRKNGGLYLSHLDFSYETELCDFEIAAADFNDWTKHSMHNSEAFKGQVACRGNVRGIVRIIIDPLDDKGFQKGDVLVTSMTRPEFISIMKKASAVITNEGGITCHAAIVSRELSIPCIIGTKVATQILKDGDLVEVDAEKGIVTILQRSI